MAQQANMSTEAFENFYFDVCTFDYAKFNLYGQPTKKECRTQIKFTSKEMIQIYISL